MHLSESQRQVAVYWLPGLMAGGVAWLVFITLGHTPPVRASGLALVIVGMTMTLRRSGAALAIIGGLALAFSPAFWTQTGSARDVSLPLALVALAATGVITLLVMRVSRRGVLALIIGFAVFALLYWSQLAGIGSLRITTLSSAWLLYLLVDALYRTNPRPDDPPADALPARHTIGMLILMAVGVVNAPLFILLAPAVALGLALTRVRLPLGYWLLLALIVGVGVYGVSAQYLRSTWWVYPAAVAQEQGLHVPFLMADGWHEASRWIMLVQLVAGQFTLLGFGLGVMGLARLSRWYPPLGTATMVAYAMYVLFGLVYFGNDSPVLLLPLLMIQILWMTYAVFALGEWLQRSVNPPNRLLRWLAPALYLWLPLLMLARITTAL
ncbi:MAG: hypothetical protein K8J31_28135 [Anaerolineae bacterium]|nr:hypothetical protein [Anaerolineae bacterium]